MRRLLAVATAVLMFVPAVAGAEPAPDNRGQERKADRLDLYEMEVEPGVESELRAEGYDVVTSEVRGNTVRLEVVMSGAEATKLESGLGLKLGLKKNKDGLATADAASELAANGFDVWRTYSEAGGIKDELEALAGQYDDLTELITIGQTVQGQDIYAMRVTERADKNSSKKRPASLYVSNQHAREWISTEVNRRLLNYYLENYGSDPRVTEILDTTQLYFVLVANPDGYDWSFTAEGNRLWRKNLADNNADGQITTADGVDPNRNFATNWGYDNEGSSPNPSSQTYRGPGPQSEPETRALDALMGSVDFSFMINYHSAAELILYGVGWQVDTPTPDDLVNIALAGDDANPAIEGYDPDLSAELYITNGDTTDHGATAHEILSFTPELATCQTASDYIDDDPFGPTYCTDEGRSGFEFPDSEELVQFEFEKNLEFALAVAESSPDPANPESPVGEPAPDFQVDTFNTSWGATQEVAVWAKREFKQLRANYSINGGAAKKLSASEWEGGERYGDEGTIWYAEYRADVTGAKPGDEVEVWFTAVDTPSGGGSPTASKVESEHFTYTVETATGADTLVVVDNSPGTPIGGLELLEHLDYYTAALDANGYSYDVYDVGVTGPAPHPLGVLNHYETVIWYTGEKLVTDYQGGINTTLLAHRMNMVMRDYINEGGKVLATGKNHGFEEFFPLNYGENGAPEEPCSDVCLVLTDDVYQYWFGGFARTRRGGLDADGQALGVAGTNDPFSSYGFGLDGGDSADNQGTPGAVSTGTASWVVTSSVLDEADFPQFASTRAAAWLSDGGAPFEPVTGEWQVASDHDDIAYKRLATTVDLTGATIASLDFATSYRTEADWDYLFVEAHTVGVDDWTTLPDANGHTGQDTGQSCPSGWGDQLHPQLLNYQTPTADGSDCDPIGATGEWHATSGPSASVEDWSIDLSSYAGSVVEVSITFATDWGTGDLGVFVDDATITVDGNVVSDTSFEADLGDWTVIGSPEGSAPNPNDWERVGILFEVASIVATDDTLLFGFGFEGISTAVERNEVMRRSIEYLTG